MIRRTLMFIMYQMLQEVVVMNELVLNEPKIN